MRIPHVIPYQGSKRKLAEKILTNIEYDVTGRLYEPFAGSAAITLASAANKMGVGYVIGDKFSPLVELWKLIVNQPEYVATQYSSIWHAQLDDPKAYFLKIRDEFNKDKDPVQFLYLVARCVKNAIRFNGNGDFNQSADNRRLGMNPKKVEKESLMISSMLKGKSEMIAGDFMEILSSAAAEDIVYMDPPWQGTSNKKDSRYAYLLDLELLIEGMADLNKRGVPFLLSFDGTCGDKSYGKELPDFLNLQKVGLDAGRSAQAILLGRDDITIESLYLSPALVEKNKLGIKRNEQLAIFS
ncbi:MAG: DNA adenine methylase [Pseudomonadales bacterium]|nr:DNA adenine methylase [Pseudomonadales bacterium]